jgi:50S ribosomal protein L16 3-hydroxylase
MNEAAAPPPRVAPVPALARLGQMPVQAFLARHWQRRPLLIRQALPGFESQFTREGLLELATRDEVESRLVDCADGRWRLRHGPFRRRGIPSPKRPGWTLLVQGVDLQVQAAADLIARFRFVPDARLDDLMVSYASDGGGVGPHVDSYDVFLLQALGKRRWRIERRPDPACVAGLPIRQLARFRPQQEWVLEPGDLLYLPPGVGHEGVAIGECVTCSIGFRTPAWAELAAVWSELQADSDGRQAALRDARIAASAHPALLPTWMVEQAHRRLIRQRPARQDVARALLRQLSEPKPRVAFEPPRKPMTQAQLADAARRRGLYTDRRTRMLYSNRTLAINGELLPLADPEQRRLIKSLADRRVLLVQAGQPLSAATLACLFEWYLAGWIHPYPAPSKRAGFEPGMPQRS